MFFPLVRQDHEVATIEEKRLVDRYSKLHYSIGVKRKEEFNMIRILLACGIGASTGFMAANMRKIAKQQGLEVKVNAVSKSQVMEYADKIDILLLGPHFSSEVPKYQSMLHDHQVKVMAIDPDDYAALDGESILESALELFQEK